MIHKRIITTKGDDAWVKRTLQNSLPEGITSKIFGDGREIAVETIQGEPLSHEMPGNKPEDRFKNPVKIHLLMFDDGSGTGRVEKASFDGLKINQEAEACNGGPDMGGPYYAVSVDLED